MIAGIGIENGSCNPDHAPLSSLYWDTIGSYSVCAK